MEGAVKELALQLAYLSGMGRLLAARRGGVGVILGFERVRPAGQQAFRPLARREITPERLDQLCTALRRWHFEVVTLDEAIRRAQQPTGGRRFAVLTFDGAYRDAASHGAPVLARHRYPSTHFVPTGFVDGIAPMWWLALEQVIARHDRISLVVDRAERHFEVGTPRLKQELYAFLEDWMRMLAPAELSHAINDLGRRYSVDVAGLSRAAAMQWPDLRALARDPLIEIGSATVSYPALSALNAGAALREMRMGRQVAEAALGREVRHFAYPFGDERAIGRREIGLAAEAGLASAVTAQARVVHPQDSGVPFALPRIGWDGRRRSLRALRVLTSGMLGHKAEKPQ